MNLYQAISIRNRSLAPSQAHVQRMTRAAPALLDALVLCMGYLERAEAEGLMQDTIVKPSAALAIARAAIRQATLGGVEL